MTIKELKELLKVLKSNGVLSYEHDGVKLSLSEYTTSSKEPASKTAIPEDYQDPTEEDLLFYSALPPKEDNQ